MVTVNRNCPSSKDKLFNMPKPRRKLWQKRVGRYIDITEMWVLLIAIFLLGNLCGMALTLYSFYKLN